MSFSSAIERRLLQYNITSESVYCLSISSDLRSIISIISNSEYDDSALRTCFLLQQTQFLTDNHRQTQAQAEIVCENWILKYICRIYMITITVIVTAVITATAEVDSSVKVIYRTRHRILEAAHCVSFKSVSCCIDSVSQNCWHSILIWLFLIFVSLLSSDSWRAERADKTQYNNIAIIDLNSAVVIDRDLLHLREQCRIMTQKTMSEVTVQLQSAVTVCIKILHLWDSQYHSENLTEIQWE